MSNPYNQEPPRFNNSVRESPYGQTIGGSHQQNNIQQGIKKLYYLIYFKSPIRTLAYPYVPIACIYIFILVPIQGQHAIWRPRQEGPYSPGYHHNPGLRQESSNGSMQNLPRASVLQANANATYQRLSHVKNSELQI